MNIKKYFWNLNTKAMKETCKIIRNPEHPQYPQKVYAILSRSDNAKEVFKILPKARFIETWPLIRKYWFNIGESEEFRSWWETVFEELTKKQRPKGHPNKTLVEIGKMIKVQRISHRWTQHDLAIKTGLDQPYISKIERGKQIQLDTLIKICTILGIKNVPIIT